jgi:hypothetical protein|tara:strand:+ start:2026 stop:2415 length:390 start_codon:yes stop_codon:yes gene_type:complete
MAKKQTFISKLGKEKKNFKFVKYIQTLPSEKTGHIKFLSRMIRMEENENIDQALKREEEESSNVLSFGEQVTEEAPAEEELKEEQPVEETPAEETQEEAPSEEPTEEAPAEESAPEEDSAEEAEESSKE